MDALCSSGKYEDVSRLYEAPDGHKWLLPLVRKKAIHSRLTSQESLPAGWGLGGVISNTPLDYENVRFIFSDLANQPVLRSFVRPNPLLSPVWEAAKPDRVTTLSYTSHILDLAGGFEVVWRERYHHPTRTAIHKAERSNLTVEIDATGTLLPVYYQLFMEWCVRRGSERRLPAWFSRWNNSRRDPLERLQRIFTAINGAGRVYLAYLDGQPIAGAIFFLSENNAVYFRGTSLRAEAGPVRANDLLQNLMIQEACRAGCRYYHMGSSAGVESLMHFKSGFGAEATPLYNYAVERLPLTQLGLWRNGVTKWIERELIRSTRRT